LEKVGKFKDILKKKFWRKKKFGKIGKFKIK
jgi:hypothetical protein